MEQTNSTNTGANQARGVMDRIRESATSQLSSQKDRATDGLGSLAHAVRQSTQSFRDNQQDTVAQYIESAADQIEQFSARVRERDVKDLVQDVQQFARRQPAVFIGAAFAVGVVAARFLKSSGDNSPDHKGGQRYGSAAANHEEPSARFDRTSQITPRYAGGGL